MLLYRQQLLPAQTYFTLRAGRFGNWRLGGGGDNLRESPYYTRHGNSPLFNRLFAAVYDLLLSKMTNMGYLIPSPSRSLKEIFQEKIHGTERYLVSAELIAYIKWLVYLAPRIVPAWSMQFSSPNRLRS